MYTIEDYVKMIAESMAIRLSDDKIKEITNQLLRSEHYNEMLKQLEQMIRIAENA